MPLVKQRNLIPAAVATLLISGLCFGSTAKADSPQTAGTAASLPKNGELFPVSRDSATSIGERLAYPATPNPEISSFTMSIAPGTTTRWMTHPVPAYLYVLEGTLTVEFADGSRQDFKAGQAFLQSQSKWHRGRNDSASPARFLAVFVGAKGVPDALHLPAGKLVHDEH